MSNFYQDVTKKDPRFNSTQVIKDVSLLEPGTRVKVAKLIVMAHEAGHELRVGETYRSQARQRQLFNQKLTQLKNVGQHGFSTACDLQLFVNGKYDPNGTDYAFFADMCKKVGLITGINWGTSGPHSFKDWDHVQSCPTFRQPELFAGTWYPDPNYDPYQDMKDHGIRSV